MTFRAQMSLDQQKEAAHAIREHTEVLRELLTDSAGHGRQFLTVANGGGAVALLAFMGSSERVRSSPFAWWGLAFFAIGVVMVGVLSLLDYFARKADLESWIRDWINFDQGKIAHEELYARLNSRNRILIKGPVIAGCLAFVLFVAGIGLSMGHFLYTSIHRPHNSEAVHASAPRCTVTGVRR